MSFTKSSENVTPTREEVYQALLRSLKRRKSFGIVFVQCSTAETSRIIQRIQQDLPEKKFGVLSLPPRINKRDIFGNKTPPVDNLYDIVANFPDHENLNIILIQGLEKSLEPYIKPGYGGDGNYYNLDTVPPILSHLNQRREKFRDDFSNICFVFILPLFAIKYLIRRAPDFFDWSAGVFAIESEQLVQESRQTYNIGNTYFSLGEIEQAIAFYEQSLAISREIKDRQGEAVALANLGNAYRSLAQYQLAVEYYQESLEICREIGNHQGEAVALANLGNAYGSLGQFERVIAFYKQSLAICREIGNRQGEANSLVNLGNAYGSLGQFERVIAFYEQSLAISREIGDRQGEANSLVNLSNAYESLGEDERAIWQFLRSKAKSPPSWLQFLTEAEIASVKRGTRKLMLPLPSEKIKLRIPANESLWMVIDLPFQNYQLLLLNRSKQGQDLLCPSSSFAPDSIIKQTPTVLPQKDSWAGNSEEKFVFEEAGKEEFLAIALEKPLSLPWLIPCEEEDLPEWNAERMKELFEQLEKQDNWQVFYQSFEVV